MLFVVDRIDVDELVLERLDKRLLVQRGKVWMVVRHRLPPIRSTNLIGTGLGEESQSITMQ